MIASEYRKQVIQLNSTWMFTNPTESSNYDPSIKSSTAYVTILQNEALQQLKWDKHEVYLIIKDVWKEKLLDTYVISWLEEIEYDVLNFTQKMSKDMLKHIKNKCLSLNKTEKIYQQKDTKFTCILEEDIAVYFTKLQKEKELLKKVGINWDDLQKFTQAVEKIYSS